MVAITGSKGDKCPCGIVLILVGGLGLFWDINYHLFP